jgi:hypothetical protein
MADPEHMVQCSKIRRAAANLLDHIVVTEHDCNRVLSIKEHYELR